MSGRCFDWLPSRIEEKCQLSAQIADEAIPHRSELWIFGEAILLDHPPHHFVGLENLNLTVGVARIRRDRSAGRIRERSQSTIFEQDSRIVRVVCRRQDRERDADAQTYEDPDEAKAPAPANEPQDCIGAHQVSIVGTERLLS